jgi:plasmid maintenance system antidote protein VapI
MSLAESLREQILTHIDQQGLQRKEIAARMNVTPAAVSNMLNDPDRQMTLAVAERLAEATGASDHRPLPLARTLSAQEAAESHNGRCKTAGVSRARQRGPESREAPVAALQDVLPVIPLLPRVTPGR